VRVLLALLILGALASLAAPSAIRAWKSHRTAENLDRATRALAAGQVARARDAAIQAYQGGAEPRQVFPLLLHSGAALNDPRAVSVAMAVVGDPDYDKSDRQAAWDLLCRISPAWRGGRYASC